MNNLEQNLKEIEDLAGLQGIEALPAVGTGEVCLPLPEVIRLMKAAVRKELLAVTKAESALNERETKDSLPENGYLVMCMGLNLFTIVRSDLDSLATVVGSVIQKAEDDAHENNTNRLPIQVYELGRQMNVSLKSVISKLEPIK